MVEQTGGDGGIGVSWCGGKNPANCFEISNKNIVFVIIDRYFHIFCFTFSVSTLRRFGPLEQPRLLCSRQHKPDIVLQK